VVFVGLITFSVSFPVLLLPKVQQQNSLENIPPLLLLDLLLLLSVEVKLFIFILEDLNLLLSRIDITPRF